MVTKDSFEERMLATLDFKSSLFEGIFDGGDDTVVLDDSRLNKILEGVSEYVDTPSQTEPCDSSSEQMETESAQVRDTDDAPETGFGIADPVAEPEETAAASPESIVSQGVAFLSGLAGMLRSEEGVRKLTDTIVRTDPQSGKSELHIPVPDKETVAGILALFGKFVKQR